MQGLRMSSTAQKQMSGDVKDMHLRMQRGGCLHCVLAVQTQSGSSLAAASRQHLLLGRQHRAPQHPGAPLLPPSIMHDAHTCWLGSSWPLLSLVSSVRILLVKASSLALRPQAVSCASTW